MIDLLPHQPPVDQSDSHRWRDYRDDKFSMLQDFCFRGKLTDPVVVRNFQPPNWLTEQGVWKKQKSLEPRFPSIKNARFITLTVDPSQYDSASEAFEICRRHLRQFFYTLDKLLKNAERTPYCWKLEFHENGWPHWHVILLHRRKIDFSLLNRAWGKGRTDIDRINGNDFKYLFKYAAKTVTSLPHYILDQKQVRFFQTSRGFLLADKASPRPNKTEKELNVEKHNDKNNVRKETTLGQRLDRWMRTLSISIPGLTAVYDSKDESYALILMRAAHMAVDQFSRSPSGDSQIQIKPTEINLNKKQLCQILKIHKSQ